MSTNIIDPDKMAKVKSARKAVNKLYEAYKIGHLERVRKELQQLKLDLETAVDILMDYNVFNQLSKEEDKLNEMEIFISRFDKIKLKLTANVLDRECINIRLANLEKMVEFEDELKECVISLKKKYLFKSRGDTNPVKPLELKPFDGNALKWPVYRKMLVEQIINNDKIPNLPEKFYRVLELMPDKALAYLTIINPDNPNMKLVLEELDSCFLGIETSMEKSVDDLEKLHKMDPSEALKKLEQFLTHMPGNEKFRYEDSKK